jgi:hypothetical protein
LHTFRLQQIVSAAGFEIDPHYGEEALRLWQQTNLELRLADFTKERPPAHERRTSLLICNPPYVRHHHLDLSDKLRLQHMTEQAAGIKLSGLAGLYCYFLGLAHAWMADGGLAGWLIPSEFMDVNYGDQVKRYLLERVTLLRIHRFVWFRKDPPPHEYSVEFSYGGTLCAPDRIAAVPVDLLRKTPKWTRFPRDANGGLSDSTPLRLSDLFKIQRGIATGANEFFVLDRSLAQDYRLPLEFLTPILPSPRFLQVDRVEVDSDGFPKVDRQLVLLNCRLQEEIVEHHYPELWRYLQIGVSQNIHTRYLSLHRSPWYAQEQRSPAPLLCTYMGRSDGMSGRPFRFILNRSHAIAANVYLLLYPKPVLQAELQRNPGLLPAIWTTLNNLAPETLMGEGRVYGGGLHKLEPKELGNASAESLLALVPQLAHTTATQLPLFE